MTPYQPTPEGERAPLGRPRTTSHDELQRLGVSMFSEHGYAETSVESIAAAAGVSRRTFFRYFPTKADVVWGDFEAEVERLRETFRTIPDEVPLMAAIRTAVVDFNRVPPEALADHRARLQLILGEPDLIARSLLKFQGWRQAIAEFVAQRLQEPVDAFVPQLLGEVSLGTAVAAYRQWLSRPEADLGVLLEAAFDAVAHAELLEEHAARGTN